MKKLIILAILLFSTNVLAAVVYTSNGTGGGDWDNVLTWAPNGVPGLTDTADILAGDTVIINQSEFIGTSPASASTYDLKLHGTLRINPAPGANIIFTLNTSAYVYNGGIFEVGTSATEFDCDYYAIIKFNTATQKYRVYIADGGFFRSHGCEGYANTSGTINRARITACAPDCNAGAARVLTLDTTINWSAAVVNPATVGGTSNPEVLIGCGGGNTDPAAELTESAEITAAPAANQITVTLANNHQIGDIVANVTHNVLFYCEHGGSNLQGNIHSEGGAFDISWTRVHDMGDVYTTAAIRFSNASRNMGTLSHVSATSCEDNATNSGCFSVTADSWDTIEYITAHDPGSSGYHFYLPAINAAETIDSATFIGEGLYGMCSANAHYPVAYTGLWVSGTSNNFYGIARSITNSLFHYAYINNITILEAPANKRRQNEVLIFDGLEIRHAQTFYGLSVAAYYYRITNSMFYNSDDSCLYVGNNSIIYTENNTYDMCNTSDSTAHSAVRFGYPDGYAYMQNEYFGTTTANKKANIIVSPPAYTNTYFQYQRVICNECTFVAATGELSTLPFKPASYTDVLATGWWYRAYVGPKTLYTLQNKNKVEGAHEGLGPGGMYFSRDTSVFYDNTLNLKIIPEAAIRYYQYELGTISVNSGQTLTVNLYLRKNETQANGFRPRLSLEGCGFDSYTDYDEMSDVNATWEKVTVTGVANAKGIVHVYVDVRNNLAPGGVYLNVDPVHPPTVTIYADGISFTKS